MRHRGRSVLTTLVFTDIVGSTPLAEELGDRRWRELLRRHNEIFRPALREHGGREVDTAGDGVFARFDSPGAAIRWAAAVQDAMRELGIEIRAGIHIGEAELLQGKLSGVNVHAAARTMAVAAGGEILVTGAVRDIVRGGGFGFADHGTHQLRGVEGEWRLFELTSVDGASRPARPSEKEERTRREAIVPPPLAKRRRVRLAALWGAGAALVAGGALALVLTLGGSSTGPLTGCEVTPYAPLNDRSFNEAVFTGLNRAATTWGINVRNRVTDPPSEKGAERNIRAFVNQRCGLIVTVGGFMGPLTAQFAKANPDQRFVTTDDDVVRHLDNLVNVVFRVDQAAFLAGYLAAGVSRTNKVATFGATPIPTVTSFLRGFVAGVLYYNRRYAAHVQPLGWYQDANAYTYVSEELTDAAFGDTIGAQRIVSNFIRAGADVVMPVDGTVGNEAAGRAVGRRQDIVLIGVDTDQFFATPQFAHLWLTSVVKEYEQMVYLAVGKVVDGTFAGGVLTGTLANRGVGLAPHHSLSPRVSRKLRRELDALRSGIADGSISLDPADYA